MIFHDRRRLGAIRSPFMVAAGYQGPGDILSTSVIGYWSLRAWTNASIGVPTVVHVRDSVGNLADFKTIAGGKIDTGAIASFLGSNVPGTIYQIYEQSGSGAGIFGQSTTANQAVYAGSGNGLTSLPNLSFNGSSDYYSGAFSSASQPISGMIVARDTFTGVGQTIFGGDAAGQTHQVGYGSGANTFYIYTQASPFSTLPATASDGSWHCIQFVINGASSVVNVDGVDVTGSIGATAMAIQNLFLGVVSSNSVLSNYFNGFWSELALWSVATTSGQRTQLYNQVHTYYSPNIP